jgi:proteasome-associated ATPase
VSFSHRDENRFLSITLRSGKKETLYRGDLISGAIIASIVERAKGLAIKRAIASGQEEGISETDICVSRSTAEYTENDIFPPRATSPRIGCSCLITTRENVVKVAPVRPGSAKSGAAPGAVI